MSGVSNIPFLDCSPCKDKETPVISSLFLHTGPLFSLVKYHVCGSLTLWGKPSPAPLPVEAQMVVAKEKAFLVIAATLEFPPEISTWSFLEKFLASCIHFGRAVCGGSSIYYNW